jgi:hypothetical protein
MQLVMLKRLPSLAGEDKTGFEHLPSTPKTMNNVLATGVNLLAPWRFMLAEAATLGRSVEVATTTDVASDDGGSIEEESDAEMVDEACVVATKAGACSFHCWPLVTVTKEVDVGADIDQAVEIDPKD